MTASPPFHIHGVDVLTGVVLARNESKNIVACLESIRPHVEEILLIDMESFDDTVSLADPLVDRVLHHQVISNFDAARNIAIDQANFEWLWFLDADERVPSQTGQQIRKLISQSGSQFEAINIPFKTHFCGKWIEHSGWWPGYTMPRVLKRGHFQFAEKLHGGVELSGREIRLPANPVLAIEHFSYESLSHYLEKLNRYTTTEAEQLSSQGSQSSWQEAVAHMVHDLWMYYELNQGHQDGQHGWLLAWLSGQYRWLQHAKQIDLRDGFEGGAPQNLDEFLSVFQGQLDSLRAQNPRLPLGVVWRSPIWDASGYADESRTLVKAIAPLDRHLSVEEIRWNDGNAEIDESDATLLKALLRGRRPTHSMTITNCIPSLVTPDPRSTLNIIRTTFETDRIPTEWTEHINAFDEVWVISQHNFEAFRRSGIAPEKMRIVPSCIDETRFVDSTSDRVPLVPAELTDRFVFLSIFDWQLRKGWDVLLRAYASEFKIIDKVGLFLKITRGHGYSIETVRKQADACLCEIGQSLFTRPDIIICDEEYSADQIASLYRHACAFVLPTRGEGWGRPFMEAMACGLPVIGTGASGNVDFMRPTNSYLIRADLAAIPELAAHEIPPYRGHNWYEPDEGHLRDLMRQVVEEREERQKIGEEGLRTVREEFDLAQGREAIGRAIHAAESRLACDPLAPVTPEQTSVRWEGELFANHSFSNINEILVERIGDHPDIGLSVLRQVHNPVDDCSPNAHRIRGYVNRGLPREVDVTIRHAFPPNWEPPEGKWIHIQPWEFGHLPKDWIKPLRDQVDEIWAPSEYVKRVYVRSGISADKIRTIPWGVDHSIFNPEVTARLLPNNKSFVFLFVGGTIHRKGFDILLKAYQETFKPDDDVCLCIKDLGTNSFYRFDNHRDDVLTAVDDPSVADIVYFEDDMTPCQLASIYRAADCLVIPYRGEGFGLPILEAMACGVMPIVPWGGASDDFVSDEVGIRLSSQEIETQHDWELAGPALELSVDLEELKRAMRLAFEDQTETREKGRNAAIHSRQFTWERTANAMVERIKRLAQVQDGIAAVVQTENSESELADCLGRIRPFVDQVIIEDKGSTDRTLKIAHEYGATIVNAESELDRFDWLICLQPQDQLAEEDVKDLRQLLLEQPNKITEVSFRRENGTALKCRRAPNAVLNDMSPGRRGG